MAQAQDIRRQQPDVSPNTYSTPGVVDQSAGLMAQAIGQGVGAVVEIDKQLALKRFGEATETLRSQYLAGNVAAGQLQDAAAGSEDEADVGYELTGNDKSALTDFEQVLGQSNAAVAQGRMTQDAFRLRGERLYRQAISKRPGLAREFRQVAGDLLGMDVVGASLDILADREKEIMQAGAGAAKTKAEAEMDRFKFLRSQFTENGFPQAGLFAGPGPEFNAFINQNYDAYQAKVNSNETVRLSAQKVALLKDSGVVNRTANGALFSSRASAIEKGFTGEVNAAIDMLRNSGKINDYQAVESVVQAMLTKLNDSVGQLNASATSDDIDDSVRQQATKRLNDTAARMTARLGISGEGKYAADLVEAMQAEAKYSLLSDDDLRMQTTLYSLVPPPVADRLAKAQEPTLILASTRAMQGVTSPEGNVVASKDVLYNIMGSVWPTGRGTPEATAVSAASTAFATLPRSFYEQEAEQFNFNRWSGQQGLLPAMAAYAPQMKGMTEEQRQKIAAEIAGSAAWGTRVALRRLFQKAPELQGTVDTQAMFNPQNGTRMFVPKQGVTWTPEQQRLADSYSGMVNPQGVAKAIQSFAPELKTSTDVWRYVAKTNAPMLEARQRASESRQKAPSNVAGSRVAGKVQTGNAGPAARWWD